jgi:two-component system, LytTR family, sensor kinase
VKNRTGLHIIFWIAYLAFETYVEYLWLGAQPSYSGLTPSKKIFMSLEAESLLLLIKIPLSYFVVYLINILAPRLHKPLLSVAIGIGAFAFAIVVYRLLVIYVILPEMYHMAVNSRMLFEIARVINSFVYLIFIVGVVVAINQYRHHQRARESEKMLVKEKLESELKFLRTQTNPHFLFNTLNNIYALARKRSDMTADVVMKLSKLLRFMLYESRNKTISIAEELRMLNDYIELEKIRYSDRLSISMETSIDDETQPIAPMILLPFVENAFKHGASETRLSTFIRIKAQLIAGHLIFISENSKDENGERAISENIGLSNVRRQLELMYPEHTLEMENGKDFFKVNLNINLLNHATIPMHHR